MNDPPAFRMLLEHIKEHTRLLTSIYEQLAKLNSSILLGKTLKNKFEDDDHMEKGTKKEEEELHEFPAPCPSSSSPAYYRLEIEGVVGVEDQTQGTPNSRTRGNTAGTTHTLAAGKPLNIRVILKKDDEKVPDDDPLANAKVKLVVLDEEFHIPYSDEQNSRPSWPQQDFTERCMHLPNEKFPTRKTMGVDKGEFRLNAGRGAPDHGATIKLNSQKKTVKLGVMIHPDSQMSFPRVLEGVSNSFLVKDPPRVKKDKTNQGVTTTESLPAKENTEHHFTANLQHSEGLLHAPPTMGSFSHTPSPTNGTAGVHHAPRPHNLMMGNYGAPGGQSNDAQGNVVPATDSNMMDVQNSAPSGQSNVPNGINYDTQRVVSAPLATFHQQGNYYGPSGQSHDAPGNVLLAATNNQQTTPGKRKRVNRDYTPHHTSWSQFSGQVQSAQNFGPHGEQPTQNCLTAPIGPPQAYAPNSDPGLAASFQTEGYNKPDDNQGHVDPSSQMGKDHVHENLQGLQTQSGQFVNMVQGNNGTGGGQGQPGTPQSNNLHTNPQGHTTTDGVTSAQMNINSTMDDLDVETGSHEQGDGGLVGNGDYGGGNNGEGAEEEVDPKFWDDLGNLLAVDLGNLLEVPKLND